MRVIVSLLVLFAAPLVCQAEEWQLLFNGKDLTGWRANNTPESFTVKDGVLRMQAAGTNKVHLFYVGDVKADANDKDAKGNAVPFKNFELEATVRSEPNSNGGIFVHTDMTTRDAALHLARGYEVQLNSEEKEKRKTGSLYAIVDLDKSPVDETKWFTIRIVVRDKRIVISIDGKEVVDYTEPADVKRPTDRAGRLFLPEGGAIALQAPMRRAFGILKIFE